MSDQGDQSQLGPHKESPRAGSNRQVVTVVVIPISDLDGVAQIDGALRSLDGVDEVEIDHFDFDERMVTFQVTCADVQGLQAAIAGLDHPVVGGVQRRNDHALAVGLLDAPTTHKQALASPDASPPVLATVAEESAEVPPSRTGPNNLWVLAGAIAFLALAVGAVLIAINAAGSTKSSPSNLQGTRPAAPVAATPATIDPRAVGGAPGTPPVPVRTPTANLAEPAGVASRARTATPFGAISSPTPGANSPTPIATPFRGVVAPTTRASGATPAAQATPTTSSGRAAAAQAMLSPLAEFAVSAAGMSTPTPSAPAVPGPAEQQTEITPTPAAPATPTDATPRAVMSPLAGPNATVPPAAVKLGSAQAVLNVLISAGLPIDRTTNDPAIADPAGLAGKPHQFSSALVFQDTRLARQSPALDPRTGGTIEVFDDADDADRRKRFLQGIAQALPDHAEQLVQVDRVLLRLSPRLSAADVAGYAQALQR